MDWTKLPKPILILAPMEDVTDTVFRRIVARRARPDVFITEFTNVEGLFSKGHDIVVQRLKYTEEERPIVAQVWGNNPKTFYKAAQLLVEMGFDGMDINMGCPVRNIVKSGAGACLINEPNLVREIVSATREGIEFASRQLAKNYKTFPLSIKTRLGLKTVNTEEWIGHLLSCNIDALTIHGRTAKEMSKVPAHWDEIGKAVTLRNQMKKDTIIIGNGDITGYQDATRKAKKYGIDGVMIGRGIFHNLWAFEKNDRPHTPAQQELFSILKEHVELFDAEWGNTKNFAILKKFFKIYIQGFDNATDVRVRFMEAKNIREVLDLLTGFFPESGSFINDMK